MVRQDVMGRFRSLHRRRLSRVANALGLPQRSLGAIAIWTMRDAAAPATTPTTPTARGGAHESQGLRRNRA